MMSAIRSNQRHRGPPKDRVNPASHVLAETAEHWATEIGSVAQGLLQAAALADRIARGNGDSERRLRRAVCRLGTKLHAHLVAARDWERVVSANGAADQSDLQPAIEALRRSVERASVLLLQADTLVAMPDPALTRSVPTDDSSFRSGRDRADRQSRLWSLPGWNSHLTDRCSDARPLPSATDDQVSPDRYAAAA